MRVTVQAGLGLALMGGLLTAACGDESRSDRAIDSPAGSGGMAGPGETPAPGGAPGAAGVGGAPGYGGRASSGESPPPPAGAIRLIAPLSGGRCRQSADGPLQAGAGVGAVTVELCADRDCASMVRADCGDGYSATATAELAASHVFWRVRAGTATSATWEGFSIPHRTAAPSAAQPPPGPTTTATGLATSCSTIACCWGDRAVMRAASRCRGRRPPRTRRFRPGGRSERRRLRRRPAARRLGRADAFGIWTPTPFFGGPAGFTAGSATRRRCRTVRFTSRARPATWTPDGYADFLFKTRFTPVTYMGGAGRAQRGAERRSRGSQSFYAFGADYDGDGFADAASCEQWLSTILVTRGGPAGFDPAEFTTLTLPLPPSIGHFATSMPTATATPIWRSAPTRVGRRSSRARPAGSARRRSRPSALVWVRFADCDRRLQRRRVPGFGRRRRGWGPSPSWSTTGRRGLLATGHAAVASPRRRPSARLDLRRQRRRLRGPDR